jgi:hypothetical protein
MTEKVINDTLKKFNDKWNCKIDSEAIKKEYPATLEIEQEDAKTVLIRKQRAVGEAIRLIDHIEASGNGTDEELRAAYTYFIVAMNTFKYLLDVKKAKIDLGIQELKNKFMK